MIWFFSDGYTTADLVFKWKDTGALSIKENLELPEFQITSTKVGDCTRVFSTGVYEHLFFSSFLTVHLYWMIQAIIVSLPTRIDLQSKPELSVNLRQLSEWVCMKRKERYYSDIARKRKDRHNKKHNWLYA